MPLRQFFVVSRFLNYIIIREKLNILRRFESSLTEKKKRGRD